MEFIPLIIYIVLVAVLFWVVRWALATAGVPEPIRTGILIIIGCVILLWVVNWAGIGPPSFRVR